MSNVPPACVWEGAVMASPKPTEPKLSSDSGGLEELCEPGGPWRASSLHTGVPAVPWQRPVSHCVSLAQLSRLGLLDSTVQLILIQAVPTRFFLALESITHSFYKCLGLYCVRGAGGTAVRRPPGSLFWGRRVLACPGGLACSHSRTHELRWVLRPKDLERQRLGVLCAADP